VHVVPSNLMTILIFETNLKKIFGARAMLTNTFAAVRLRSLNKIATERNSTMRVDIR
jgi:hypothetical protein